MKRAIDYMVNSWKTSISGLVVGVSGFIHVNRDRFVKHPDLVMIADFIFLGGLASLGLLAKDSDKGSNKPHDEMPKNLQGPPAEGTKGNA